MTHVAVGARDFIVVMLATMPTKPSVPIVTVEAHRVLAIDACYIAGLEIDDWRAFLTAPHPGRVRPAWPVAGLALQLAVSERAA